MSLVLTRIVWSLKQEVNAELAAKGLPGTTVTHGNQLHDRDLELGEHCKYTFDVISSELKPKFLYGARSFYKASFLKTPHKEVPTWKFHVAMLQNLASWLTQFWFISGQVSEYLARGWLLYQWMLTN